VAFLVVESHHNKDLKAILELGDSKELLEEVSYMKVEVDSNIAENSNPLVVVGNINSFNKEEEVNSYNLSLLNEDDVLHILNYDLDDLLHHYLNFQIVLSFKQHNSV